MTPEEYMNAFKEDAVKEMYLHKMPACITLAQGMLESIFKIDALSDLFKVISAILFK